MAATARKYETEIHGNVIHLVQPKAQNNKKRGKKSEVYPYEIQDVKRLLEYFEEKEQWIHYLALTLSCNMARRIGDTLCLNWENFFDPSTGKIRADILEIEEEKTDKLANPHINSAVRNAINIYISKTRCKPEKNGYHNPVFMQLSGTHRGSILTESGHLKALKRAAKELEIEYNIGTHSGRKFFGKINRQLHPGDYDSMEILQTIYNHSDTKTTKHYIGLTKKKVDQYYDDMGTFFDDYIVGDKEYIVAENKLIVSLDSNDLRDIIKAAYEAGSNNSGSTDAMVHVNAITSLMNMVEELMI